MNSLEKMNGILYFNLIYAALNKTVNIYATFFLLLVYLTSTNRYNLWQLAHLTSHQLEYIISQQLSHSSVHHTLFFHTHPHTPEHSRSGHHHYALELLMKAWDILDHLSDEQLIRTGKFSPVAFHIIVQSYRKEIIGGQSGQICSLYRFAVIEFMALIPDPPPWTDD